MIYKSGVLQREKDEFNKIMIMLQNDYCLLCFVQLFQLNLEIERFHSNKEQESENFRKEFR